MKELSAHASGDTPASIERCFELLSAIERYPDWHPKAITAAEVLERGPDGLPTKARATLHLSAGFLERDFHLDLDVTTARPTRVELSRIPDNVRDAETFNVSWVVTASDDAGAPSAIVEVDLRANLAVPPFVPLGTVADSLANGFLDAALAALDG